MNTKQRKALEAKAKKKIEEIIKKHSLFRDVSIAITFKKRT